MDGDTRKPDPAPGSPDRPQLRFPPPPPIPHHTVLRCIGSGSYGQVWLAQNAMGAFRAVKIVYRGCFSDEKPFERELSGIRKFEPVSRSHEGFIDILHIGLDQTAGCFFYVMELGDDCILGQAINPETYAPRSLATEITSRGKLSFQECLSLGLALSASLAELHKRALVHRDIKPANIIFVEGVPKLADIGLVAALDEARSYVGTEGFIPPEGPGTPQADIYSLGKVLYEATTGKDRHHFPELPPSVTRYEDLSDFLELNTVVLRACEANPQSRYKSAAQMHADLLVLVHGKSVLRLRKLERTFLRLKRVGIAAGAAALIGTAIAYPIYQSNRAKDEAAQREIGAAVAYGNKAMDSGDLIGSLPYYAKVLELHHRHGVDEATDRLRLGLILAQCPKLVQLWREPTPINDGEFSPDGKMALIALDSETVDLCSLNGSVPTRRPFSQFAHLETAVFSHSGRGILTASEDGAVCLRDAATLDIVWKIVLPDRVRSASFNIDDSKVVVACRDGWGRVLDVKTGKQEFGVLHGAPLRYAELSHNGAYLATAGEDARAVIWDATNGHALHVLAHTDWVYQVRFNHDDTEVATSSADQTAAVWMVSDGSKRFPVMRHEDAVFSVEFSPDGRCLLTACLDGTAQLWQADTLQAAQVNHILRLGERVTHAAFASDGRRVLLTGAKGAVRVWDIGGVIPPPPPTECLYSPDGSRFLAPCKEGAQLFDTATGAPAGPPCHVDARIADIRLSESGHFGLFAADVPPRHVQIIDLLADKPVGPTFRIESPMANSSFNENALILAAFGSNMLEVIAGQSGQRLFTKTCSNKISGVEFEASGRQLAFWDSNLVEVVNAAKGQEPFPPLQFSNLISGVCIRPDATELLASCWDDQWTECYAQVWDLALGKPIGPELMHGDGVLGCAFSPDGLRCGTASEDYTAMIWDAEGKPVVAPLRHHDQVQSIRF